MANFLAVLTVLLLVAVFNPARTVPHIRTKKGVQDIECTEGESSSYCTDLKNYPDQTELDNLVQNDITDLEPLFGNDLSMPENDTSQRSDIVQESLCSVRRRLIFPKAGKDSELDWLFIVNTNKFTQGIEIEECVNEGETCGESQGLTVPNNYKIECKQEYVHRVLVGFIDGNLTKAQLKFPSCCKCHLTYTCFTSPN